MAIIHLIGNFDKEGAIKSHQNDVFTDDINQAEITFIWLNSPDEAGIMAKEVKKISDDFDGMLFLATPGYFEEIESLYNCTGHSITINNNPIESLDLAIIASVFLDAVGKMCESPIEELFWNRAKKVIHGIMPQRQVGRYRIDFVIESVKVGIEIDGHEYHKTKEQRTRDAVKERYLESRGWRIIRFTGSEIYKDIDKCIGEVFKLVNLWVNEDKNERNH